MLLKQALRRLRARLRAQAAADYIDTSSTDPQESLHCQRGISPGDSGQKAVALGYNATEHTLYYSQQSTLDYTVVIEPVEHTRSAAHHQPWRYEQCQEEAPDGGRQTASLRRSGGAVC